MATHDHLIPPEYSDSDLLFQTIEYIVVSTCPSATPYLKSVRSKELVRFREYLSLISAEAPMFRTENTPDIALCGRLAGLSLAIDDAYGDAVHNVGKSRSVTAEIAATVVDLLLTEAGYEPKLNAIMFEEVMRKHLVSRCTYQFASVIQEGYVAGSVSSADRLW